MATLSDIDLSNRTAVLDLEEQELEDINACLDRLILKQTEAVEFSGLDGQDIDEGEQKKLDKYIALKAKLVEGPQNIIARDIIDIVNALNTTIAQMERLGEDDEEPETFDRYTLLLDEFQQLKQDMERPVPQRPYGSYK